MTPDSSQSHFDRLLRLLALESEAEAQQVLERMRRFTGAEAERSGYSLVSLLIAETQGGLGGRFLVTLAKRGRAPLPWTTLGVGSPVLLSEDAAKTGLRGVVSELQERQITVALETFPEDFDEELVYRLDLSTDETTRKRQKQALAAARNAQAKDKDERLRRLAQLRDVLLGDAEPQFTPKRTVTPRDEGLNDAQLDAVTHALSAEDLAIVHGPPGTGKTRTVVEIIRQAVERGDRVLACAPSNLGVDNMLERLAGFGVSVVRLGHPARVLPELRAHTLDLMVEEHEDFRLAKKLMREAQKIFQQADRWTRAKPEPGAKQALRQEARGLLRDARRLEQQAAERILSGAKVICATTTGLDPNMLGDRYFDLVVIDEAAQAVEPGAWIPLLRGKRVVLAGDHLQLPPTIVSRAAAREGFGISMMERLVARYGATVSRRLVVQYRMNEKIMRFPSDEFYDAGLVAAPAVSGRLLTDLDGVTASPHSETPVSYVDTAGAGFDEETEPDGESRLNPREAEVVTARVQELRDLGLAPEQIAVIAPYGAQVRLLRQSLLGTGIEVDTVDGFQGREKEAVVISCVRSNPDGEIGFLAELRRMNVALTRAKRKLVVVGDSATLASLPFYQRLTAYFESIGAYASVFETMSFH